MAEKSKQSKGGDARKTSLTPSERSRIAKQAAEVRWAKDLPEAAYIGVLQIGDIEFECAVLEDETRVVSETKFMQAMGIYRSGALSSRREPEDDGARPPLHLAFKNLKPFVDQHLGDVHNTEVRYRSKSGSLARGIKADALPRVCEVWLDARKAGVLGKTQEVIAEKADILIRSFARVGIVALVDEATGYQYVRQRDALEKLLEEYLSEELRKWVRTFPAEYFKELCRLRGVSFRPDMRLPQYFGHLTNDIVYKRLHPRVLEELKQKSTDENGNRTNKLHQWLSEDKGNPRLIQHLGTVIGYMRIAKDYEEFHKYLEVGAPIPRDLPLFKQIEDENGDPIDVPPTPPRKRP